jgi:cellulose synthase/poly-beta-1,6-N-acetylglucosamine synthase-like glycosyltransferase
LTIVIFIALAALLLLNLAVFPYFLFLLTTALAAVFSKDSRRILGEPASRFLIAIPAHDEESGIATTVRSCRGANYPSAKFDVLVIADNCSDRTSTLALAAGARVVERFDPTNKSKGYAIEYLMNSLIESGELQSLDAVVIIDADTKIDPDLLRYFDSDLRAGRDWIQCYYTVANPDQSSRTRLMTYALSLYNGVVPFGLNTLGLSAGFKGNGMCFSTRGLRRIPWRSYGLVEDMEYSWTLRLAGEKIHFERGAAVYGAMVRSGGEAAASQRRRWEFGRNEMRRRFLGPFLRKQGLSPLERLASIMELTIPPMIWVFLIYVTMFALNAAALVAPAVQALPVVWGALIAFQVVITVALGLYAVAPFLAMRLPLRYASSLALLPVYLGWKVLVSRAGRPDQWVRTAREPHAFGDDDHEEDPAPTEKTPREAHS